MTELRALTRLDKVWPPIVVRRVILIPSCNLDPLEFGPLQLSGNPWSIPLNHPPRSASLASSSICSTKPLSLRAGVGGLVFPRHPGHPHCFYQTPISLLLMSSTPSLPETSLPNPPDNAPTCSPWHLSCWYGRSTTCWLEDGLGCYWPGWWWPSPAP